MQKNVEKIFYKLMDNVNFGFDCRNNANNTKLITYIKKYYNLFDSQVANFVTS